MRQGVCFPLPERPRDVDRLWSTAQEVPEEGTPEWLTPDCDGLYRFLPPHPAGRHAAPARLAAEFEELELAGLIVERDPDQPWRSALFVPHPWPEPWFSIGLYSGRSPFALTPASEGPLLTGEDVTDIVASYVADPFMVRTAAGSFLFFEAFNWRANKGELAVASSPDGRSWRYEGVVLAEPFHLSYPHVFRAGDAWYMTPESAQAGAVRLYRSERFPFDWTCVGTLVERDYVADPTVVEHDGRWWLFAEGGDGSGYDELRLYVADRVEGPWREHRASPIVRGEQAAARPAGRMVPLARRLVRFAQDCRQGYGTGVRAFVVKRLTLREYVDAPLGAVVGPGRERWNATGMHHVDLHDLGGQGWLAYVDGRDAPEDRI